MKESKFTDAQKVFIIKQGEDGMTVAEICRKAGISQATYHNWKKKFRAECLNAHWFMGLEDTAEKLEAWRRDYNEERPYSAIGNQVPAALMKLPDATSPSV